MYLINLKYYLLTQYSILRERLIDFVGVWIGHSDTSAKNAQTELVEPLTSRIDNIFNIHYQHYKKAIVVTPTTGSACLKDALESVSNQGYKNLDHLVVIDGAGFEEDSKCILNQFKSEHIKIMTLPFNTGSHGFNGHRIYAAASYLINSDYVFFLDQDNWYDENHVGSLVDLMETENLDWAYSLRKIYKESTEFVVNDNCESLGSYPSYSRRPNLVDTNCYALRRRILTQVAQAWYHPLQADRHFFQQISSKFPNFKTTSQYSVNYRLTANRPPTPEFFLQGNQFMLKKYNGNLPWLA